MTHKLHPKGFQSTKKVKNIISKNHAKKTKMEKKYAKKGRSNLYYKLEIISYNA